MIVANLAVLFVGFAALPIFIKAVSIPKNILFPIIGILIFVGTYVSRPRFFNLWVVIVFGVLGYLMIKFGFSIGSFCIGYILGHYAEVGFNHTLIITRGNYLRLFSRPAFLIVLSIIITMGLLVKIVSNRQRKIESQKFFFKSFSVAGKR